MTFSDWPEGFPLIPTIESLIAGIHPRQMEQGGVPVRYIYEFLVHVTSFSQQFTVDETNCLDTTFPQSTFPSA